MITFLGSIKAASIYLEVLLDMCDFFFFVVLGIKPNSVYLKFKLFKN
jgi:hypothetical protein